MEPDFPRHGRPIDLLGGPLHFSLRPVKQRGGEWERATTLYAADVWAVADSAVDRRLDPDHVATARSFIRQAREFYRAATKASAIEAAPLLYYYSFLNLAKAILLTRRQDLKGVRFNHGISALDDNAAISEASLKITTTPGKHSVPVFARLHESLEGVLPAQQYLSVADIMPQIVIGHRLYLDAEPQVASERFLPVDPELRSDDESAWVRLRLRHGLLGATGLTAAQVHAHSGLPKFRLTSDSDPNHNYFGLEPAEGSPSSEWPYQAALSAVRTVRVSLHETITLTSPYRRYYLYLTEPNGLRLPQWATAYLMLFWLGTRSRYAPQHLLADLDGSIGGFLREFLATQPAQLLYLLVSDLKGQDVSRASIV